MDGNGRWAERRGQPRLEGHNAGTANIRRVARCAVGLGIEYLTLFAFSTENWSRPTREVDGLMGILGRVIARETEELHKEGVRLNHLGRMDRLPSGLGSAIGRSIELTRNNQGLVLSVAFDYGGRDDLLHAVRQIIADGLAPEDVDEGTLDRYLYTAGLPDPDLIIRTAGEMRLSNFLLWQATYSEYYATDILWPDFDEHALAEALAAYRARSRRFGSLCPPEAG
jgi:undecaprenyl diphosphate synthase